MPPVRKMIGFRDAGSVGLTKLLVDDSETTYEQSVALVDAELDRSPAEH